MNLILNASEPTAITRAGDALRQGGVVGMPTETVYGLAADASSEAAVRRIYEIKGRPLDHPVIVHIADAAQIDEWAVNVPDFARALVKAFWPGPLTLILPKADHVGLWLTGGQESVGLRSPSHPVAQRLLQETGLGLAAPSANRFGRVSATSAQDVADELGGYLDVDRDLILDGGVSDVGVESTIVDCTGSAPAVLRLGAITVHQIEEATGLKVVAAGSTRAPGTLAQHYSPLALVKLEGPVTVGDGLIAMSDIPTPDGVIRLASPTTVEEYAHDLYHSLREADRLEIPLVVAIPPKGEGLAAAIRDRLQRASND